MSAGVVYLHLERYGSQVGRLVELTDHVLVRTSEMYMTTTTVVLAGDGRCLVVDPAISKDDMAELTNDLTQRGLQVVAGFSTHPHWDHVLWSLELGSVPRFATDVTAKAIIMKRQQNLLLMDESAPGHNHALFGQLTGLPAGTVTIPWDGPRIGIMEHQAHAPGHAALFIHHDGVLVAGDMCSDTEVPLLDLDRPDPIGDYRQAIDLFSTLTAVRHVVPGHGTVGDGDDLRRRLRADVEYLDALEAGHDSRDPRLTVDWLIRDHDTQLGHFSDMSSG